MTELQKLQNGSDIRGVALETAGGQPVNLTPETAERIGSAFAVFLSEQGVGCGMRVSVGRDSRVTGEALSAALTKGLRRMGASVTDFGLCSTPAMFMSTVRSERPFDGAVMLTASHLPMNRNGMKFFTPAGGLEKANITRILELAEKDGFPAAKTPGAYETEDFLSAYAAGLVAFVRRQTGEERPLAGLHIVVDAGNGAGGFYADRVLMPLGADTAGSRYLDPDGSFPNHAPNPEDETAMAALREAVRENSADLGILFDTDVDRAGAVAPDGTEWNRNRLIALIAAIVLGEHPGTTVVTDSVTSAGLGRFIAQKGGVHHRFKRGYRNVINESIRLNAAGTDSQLAMETSGHGALRENYFLDDGAYLITKILVQMARCRKDGQSLSALLEGLTEPAESVELRLNIAAPDFKAYGQGVIGALRADALSAAGLSLDEPNHEGVRIRFDPSHGNGWCLLRLSLHDPLLPLNIESDEAGGLKRIAGQLYAFLKPFDGLDTSPLQTLVNK